LSPIVLALALAACGGGGTTSTTVPDTTGNTRTTVRVYFLRDTKVWPVARQVPRGPVAAVAFSELLRGPRAAERQLGLDTEVHLPARAAVPAIRDGVAIVSVREFLSTPAQAQIVYTLTQFPTVKAVELNGARLTRADFEDFTPAILVESPLAFEGVKSPLRVTGTANTFEATFEYELADPDGQILADHFVTATSGSGTRGTFDLTIDYATDREGLGALIVFERSAKDGSRIHLVEIPLRMDD